MRRVGAWAIACAIAASLALTLASPATAAGGVKAVIRWTMAPLMHDANNDGIVDGDGGVPVKGALTSQPSARRVGAGNHRAQPNERMIDGRLSWYLPDAVAPLFRVRLDACDSRGRQYRWRVSSAAGATRTPWRDLQDCRTTVRLPEGPASLVLEVRTGSSRATAQTTANVRHLLIVAMGDSYSSGEGNPRNVEAWLREGGSLTPYWDDDTCNRSARGAPALAAQELEDADTHSSVTLVDVACSGATIASGVLGPQPGSGISTGQLELARQIIGARPVDIVMLGIGGNDDGFTSVLETCALNSDCPLARPPAGPLARYPTLQQGVQAATAALPKGYARIAACLGGTGCTRADGSPMEALAMAPDGMVVPTMYPDITRSQAGEPCTYLTISASEFAWTHATILDPSPPNPYPFTTTAGAVVPLSTASGSLNGQIQATSTSLGWHPADGAWLASGTGPTGHGVCAGDSAWVFGLTALSALPSASFHPNPAGQQAIADALVGAIRSH